jgi:hypothetical protein
MTVQRIARARMISPHVRPQTGQMTEARSTVL